MVVLVDAAKSAKEKLKTAALATKAAVALAVAASADAGPISDAERSRMNTLRDMLQAKIQEQVMIVKLGEVITIEQAEAQLEQLVRLRQMEDLVTYLRFVGKPMHEEDEMNVDVLVGRVVKALDWQPLKEALGINEHGGKARRRVRPLAPPFPRCRRHSAARRCPPPPDAQCSDPFPALLHRYPWRFFSPCASLLLPSLLSACPALRSLPANLLQVSIFDGFVPQKKDDKEPLRK